MALSQAAGFLVLLLVIQPCQQNQTNRNSVSSFFEEPKMCTKASHINDREEQEAAVSSFDYVLQVVINTSDTESLLALVSNLRSPPLVNTTFEITSIHTTTVCSPTGDAYQCRCGENYSWSYNNCVNQNACDDIIGGTCGCLSDLPADGQYCQPNPCRADLVDIEIVVDLRFPVSSVSSNFVQILKDKLTRLSFPQTLAESLTVTGLNFTTGCFPNFLGGLQCQCEEQFAWSCDRCDIYGACSNATNQTCGCINGLPSDGEFCEPITNVTQCSTPTMAPITTMNPTQTPAPSTPTERSLSFTLDLPFDDSYNDKNNSVYQIVSNAIKSQSEIHISTFRAVLSINFRSGSTIVSYTLGATSFQEPEINSVKEGIFSALAGIYPVVFDSPTALQFDPVQVLFGEKVTVKCGPPPPNLNFSTEWIAEWKRDNVVIPHDDQHKFLMDGTTLTVLKFFSTDNGVYECTLRGAKSTFRQRSSGIYEHKPSSVITVSPIRRTVQCLRPSNLQINCSVNSPFEVEFKDIATRATNQITYQLPINCDNDVEKIVICQVKGNTNLNKKLTLLLTKKTSFLCQNDNFGVGNKGDLTEGPCDGDNVGEKVLVCQGDGVWRLQRDNCILRPLRDLREQSQLLNINSLPTFLKKLSDITLNFTKEVAGSPANINIIVEILNIVANLNISISETSMRDILVTAGVLTTDGAKQSWNILNTDKIRNISAETKSRELSNINSTKGVSSSFLLSLETFTKALTGESFDIDTPLILLNKTTFTDNFNAEFKSSVEINLVSDGRNKSITVITFASMHNVLTARDVENSTFNVINGRVVLVQSSGAIKNVSFTYDIFDAALRSPKCVFWNFSLFEGLGGWNDKGCKLVNNSNTTVTCNCNHLTSFSILMSPDVEDNSTLNLITYIGVGISICSLVICLIIEAVVWRKIRSNNTSYLRHVSIVNIAVSLLIADVWFIIGAFISKEVKKFPEACTAATFFIHYFYLALFFWMLASALLLFYRTVIVFDVGLSKKSMLVIGFTLGYGAPLVIAIITIAATLPREVYVRDNVCWLNWGQSYALLAFVVPAFLIIGINFIILLLVMYKILIRRVSGTAEQAAERHILLVITRSLAVLTPLFGLTWGLGVGTLTDPKSKGIHGSFAFFNSLQGFFILVFGTLLDRQVQSELAQMANGHWSGIRSTTSGISSSGGLGFLQNWRRGRDVYHVSSGQHSTSPAVLNT